MKRLALIILFGSLLFTACQKSNEEPQPTPTPEKPVPLTPAQLIVGEWRLVDFKDASEEPLSNCTRQSSLAFSAAGTATRTLYYYTPTPVADEPKDACNFVAEAMTYTITNEQIVLSKVSNTGTVTEVHSYRLQSDTLTMVYTYENIQGTQSTTATYQKNFVYDPAKEIIGTWYIHSLWRNDSYDYSEDLVRFNGCRGQQKVIISKDSIIIDQWRYTKKQCRETVYRGTYQLSVGKGILIVKNRLKGKENIGLKEFRVGNGTLEFWGFVNGLGGDYENEYYKHKPKY